MESPKLRIKRLPHSQGLALPSYATSGAAGMDLRAALAEHSPIDLAPGARALVPTGLQIELPPGHEAQVRPRSGLAVKQGIGVINAPGTIDEDYRGEVMVPLINHSQESFRILRGMRVAQMVIAPVTQVAIDEVDSLSDTGRGGAGFGSTGIDG